MRDTGIAPGETLAVGSNDGGWITPPPVELAEGSILRFYKDGQGLRAMYELVKSAQHSILLESYILAGDATGRAFLDLLASKAHAGVRVHVIYDSFGSYHTPLELFAKLRQAGGHVLEFHPMNPYRCRFSWRPANRDHRKLIVVDGKTAILGGINIADAYAGSWVGNPLKLSERWRDGSVSLEGPAVTVLTSTFIHIWLYATRGGRFQKALLAENLDGSKGPVGILASVPTMDSPLAGLLQNLLRGAKQSIDLTSAYFAPAGNLVQQLCLAARRGVQVRLMLPSRTDSLLMVTAARSFYEQLLTAGIMVYERQHVKLHAKSLVVDGSTTLLGSTNLDYRSIQYNCELAIILQSATFGAQMTNLFEHDIAYSHRIHASAWRHRPRLDRVVQWAVNRSRYLL